MVMSFGTFTRHDNLEAIGQGLRPSFQTDKSAGGVLTKLDNFCRFHEEGLNINPPPKTRLRPNLLWSRLPKAPQSKPIKLRMQSLESATLQRCALFGHDLTSAAGPAPCWTPY
jgi:hypothetical protein